MRLEKNVRVDYETLADDLFARVEGAVRDTCHLVIASGVPLTSEDIVDKVERGLPTGYPAPTSGMATRRDVIRGMVLDTLPGDAYRDGVMQ